MTHRERASQTKSTNQPTASFLKFLRHEKYYQ